MNSQVHCPTLYTLRQLLINHWVATCTWLLIMQVQFPIPSPAVVSRARPLPLACETTPAVVWSSMYMYMRDYYSRGIIGGNSTLG